MHKCFDIRKNICPTIYCKFLKSVNWVAATFAVIGWKIWRGLEFRHIVVWSYNSVKWILISIQKFCWINSFAQRCYFILISKASSTIEMWNFPKIDHNDHPKIVKNFLHATTGCQFNKVWWPWKEEKEKKFSNLPRLRIKQRTPV